MSSSLAVVLPLAANETAGSRLIGELLAFPGLDELIVVPVAGTSPTALSETSDETAALPIKVVSSAAGRAIQMNAGASAVTSEFVLFLHADSRLSQTAWQCLREKIVQHPDALFYFNLDFHDGPRLMRLTAWGVWIRSHWFKMPFGDQGLCLSRAQFGELGGFDEQQPYGEDHALVWAARRAGMKLRCCGATISTSARKYKDRGWLRTTVRHGLLTWRQAFRELGRSISRRKNE